MWNEKYELPDVLFKIIQDIQDYFRHIIKKHQKGDL